MRVHDDKPSCSLADTRLHAHLPHTTNAYKNTHTHHTFAVYESELNACETYVRFSQATHALVLFGIDFVRSQWLSVGD